MMKRWSGLHLDNRNMAARSKILSGGQRRRDWPGSTGCQVRWPLYDDASVRMNSKTMYGPRPRRWGSTGAGVPRSAVYVFCYSRCWRRRRHWPWRGEAVGHRARATITQYRTLEVFLFLLILVISTSTLQFRS